MARFCRRQCARLARRFMLESRLEFDNVSPIQSYFWRDSKGSPLTEFRSNVPSNLLRFDPLHVEVLCFRQQLLE
jgi:hypothetical protein